jgi:hypothetical protein
VGGCPAGFGLGVVGNNAGMKRGLVVGRFNR